MQNQCAWLHLRALISRPTGVHKVPESLNANPVLAVRQVVAALFWCERVGDLHRLVSHGRYRHWRLALATFSKAATRYLPVQQMRAFQPALLNLSSPSGTSKEFVCTSFSTI